jgi:predicted phosphodiesterase
VEQTLKNFEGHNIDVFYCLGDLVGYNLYPNFVTNEIRIKHISTLAGNHNVKAAEINNDSSNDTENYTYQIVGKEQKSIIFLLFLHILNLNTRRLNNSLKF